MTSKIVKGVKAVGNVNNKTEKASFSFFWVIVVGGLIGFIALSGSAPEGVLLGDHLLSLLK